MPSPYSFWRTVRWPYDFLNPYHGAERLHFRSDRSACLHAAQPNDPTARICFVGDLMVSQADTVPRFCSRVRELIASADRIVGTCEAPVSHARGRPEARYFSKFVMPRDYLLGVLDSLGLSPHSLTLSLANNHINDNGFDGIIETLALLDDLGVHTIGVRHDGRSGVDRRIVGEIPLSFVAWTQWMNDRSVIYDGLDINWQRDLPTLTAQLAGDGDALKVAVPHWGYEFRHVPRAQERSLARDLLSSGKFDLIVGSHTHSVQGLELINGRLCAYSLGNFVFAQAPYLGLGRAWSLGLVPILLVDVVKPAVGRPYVAGYRLEMFYQSGTVEGTTVGELEDAPPEIREKLARLIRKLYA